MCQWAEGLGGLRVAITMIQANAAQPQFAEQGAVREGMMPFVKPPFPTKRAEGFLIEIFLSLSFDHGLLNASEDRLGFSQGQPQILGP